METEFQRAGTCENGHRLGFGVNGNLQNCQEEQWPLECFWGETTGSERLGAGEEAHCFQDRPSQRGASAFPSLPSREWSQHLSLSSSSLPRRAAHAAARCGAASAPRLSDAAARLLNRQRAEQRGACSKRSGNRKKR